MGQHTVMPPTNILMACPTCSHRTVVVASGGHLTCTWIECPQPSVERTVADLLVQAEELKALRAKVDQVNRTLSTVVNRLDSANTLDAVAPMNGMGKVTMEVIRPADVLRPQIVKGTRVLPPDGD